jgi:hypothetical protein
MQCPQPVSPDYTESAMQNHGWYGAFIADGPSLGGCQMRSVNGRWRGLLVWTITAALVVTGLAVALGARTVLGWLAAAVLGGVAATIAGLVQGTANKGLATGKEVLIGASPPITISVEYWQQPLRIIRDPDQDLGDLVRCGYVVLLVETTADQAVVLKRTALKFPELWVPVSGFSGSDYGLAAC